MRTVLRIRPLLLLTLSTLALGWAATAAASPAQILAAYEAKAGAPGSPDRGQQFYATPGKGDMGWSCASCHGRSPTSTGRHDVTEKRIPPLAPSANAARFTDAKKVEGWFQTNCKDVHRRECTAQEKADFIAWLISLK